MKRKFPRQVRLITYIFPSDMVYEIYILLSVIVNLITNSICGFAYWPVGVGLDFFPCCVDSRISEFARSVGRDGTTCQPVNCVCGSDQSAPYGTETERVYEPYVGTWSTAGYGGSPG